MECLWAAKFLVAGVALVVTGAVYLYALASSPKYASEAQILIEVQETAFTRPEVERGEGSRTIDELEVVSQVQVLRSRDVAQQVIDDQGLKDDPRFDFVINGLSPLKAVFVLLGLSEDPMRLSPQERVYREFADGLSVFNIPESYVIVVRYESDDPELSARLANAVAETYQNSQRATQAANTRSASSFLETEIAQLRTQVSDAEAAVARFRSGSGLFLGVDDTTISAQQLSETSSELTRARAEESTARSRAQEIRQLIDQQGTRVALPDSFATPLTRRLQEEQATLRSRIAELSATLLPQHPRLRELNAQLGELGGQIRAEASRIAQRFDNEARVAAARASALEDALARQSAEAARIAEAEVELQALEREAAAQRDLLASYLVRFREAATREDAALLPTNARIIQTAQVESEAIFPRTLPMIAIAFVGSVALSLFGVMSHAVLATATRDDQRNAATFGSEPQVFLPDNEARSNTARDMAVDPAATHSPITRFRSVQKHEKPGNDEPSLRTYDLSDADECRLLFSHLRRASHPGFGTRVTVGASDERTAAGVVGLKLGRAMARAGRSVVMLDCVGELLAKGVTADGPGFHELVTGTAGFGEALHGDEDSPLHIIPAGFSKVDMARIADDAADLVLSALAENYEAVIVNAGHDPRLLLDCARINDVMVLSGMEARNTALARTLSSVVAPEHVMAVRLEEEPREELAVSA